MSAPRILDTSGAVLAPEPFDPHDPRGEWRWPDLSPFEQGYFRAQAEELARRLMAECGLNSLMLRFRDWSPETLAAIRKDCAAFGQTWRMQEPEGARPGPGFARGEQGGRDFWMMRQRGALTDPPFPPLTPFLDDEGKVRLR